MIAQRKACSQRAFSLVEVLLALLIISISLTALLRATGQDLRYSLRLRDKSLEYWVATQAVTQIQSKLVQIKRGRLQTMQSTMLNQEWYWQAKMEDSPIRGVQRITIFVSANPSGPFRETLIAFQLVS